MARPPQANALGKWGRVLYLMVNFVVWIFGLILIAVGGFILQDRETYAFVFSTSANDLTIGCWILIGEGCLVFLVGFNGVWACVRESVPWMKVYFVFMLIIIIGNIATGVLAFTRREEARAQVKNNMREHIKTEYGKGGIVDQGYNELQQALRCCAESGPGDWNNSYFSTLPGNDNIAVPITCCKDMEAPACNKGNPGQPVNSELVFNLGCGNFLADFQSDNMTMMGLISFIMVGLETVSLLLVCCVIGTRPVQRFDPDAEKERVEIQEVKNTNEAQAAQKEQEEKEEEEEKDEEEEEEEEEENSRL